MTTVLPNGELQSNPRIAYNKGYEKGRADEQIHSIEDAKKQATEYLDALDKAKEEAYEQGKADQKKKDNEFFNFEGAWELEKQKIKAEAIEDVIKTLAKSEDTILSDKQYYTLMKLKGAEE